MNKNPQDFPTYDHFKLPPGQEALILEWLTATNQQIERVGLDVAIVIALTKGNRELNECAPQERQSDEYPLSYQYLVSLNMMAGFFKSA